jgi:glucose 1-dehydrogenase
MDEHNQEALPEATIPECPDLKILTGQKALVTGASRGIGRAIAIALGGAGADVVVNYLQNEAEAESVVDEIKSKGAGAIAIQADVSRESNVREMFRRMFSTFGTIDILVNNAGIQSDAEIHEMTLDQWNAVITVNLTGQFLCAREAVREFFKHGIRKDVSCAAGKIINISSVHEIIPWTRHANYAASKGGVMLLTRSMAQELAPRRIRVNSICPGAIRTSINRPAWEKPEAYAELMGLSPYKRIGEPEDVARAAVWLASDRADYVNGISLYIDGGMTLYPGFTEGG